MNKNYFPQKGVQIYSNSMNNLHKFFLVEFTAINVLYFVNKQLIQAGDRAAKPVEAKNAFILKTIHTFVLSKLVSKKRENIFYNDKTNLPLHDKCR